jgi:hypothetical protein
MMTIRTATLFACALLAACAQQPQQPQQQPAKTGTKAETGTNPPPKIAEATPVPRRPPLPAQELTEHIMFKLMLAEVAAQAAADCSTGLPRAGPRNQGSAHRTARHRARLERA